MKHCRKPGLNRLRDCYGSVEDLGRVINRSRDYVLERILLRREFTEREKTMILLDLGNRYTEEELFSA